MPSLENRKSGPRWLWVSVAGIVATAGLATSAIAVNRGGSGEAVDRSADLAAIIGSDKQESALRDSIVTVDEYQSAISDTLRCFDSNGLTVTDVGVSSNGIIYEYSVISEEDKVNVMDECYRDNGEAVDMAWQLSMAPLREEIERDIGDCLRSSGVKVPEGAPDHVEVLRASAPEKTWNECVVGVQRRSDVAPMLLPPLEWQE